MIMHLSFLNYLYLVGKSILIKFTTVFLSVQFSINDFQIELCVSYCSTLFLLISRLTRHLFYFSLSPFSNMSWEIGPCIYVSFVCTSD